MACDVKRDKKTGEITDVFNSKGKPSKLYADLLSKLGDKELALDAWAASFTKSFRGNSKSTKEASAQKVLEFLAGVPESEGFNMATEVKIKGTGSEMNEYIKVVSGVDLKETERSNIDDLSRSIVERMKLNVEKNGGAYRYKDVMGKWHEISKEVNLNEKSDKVKEIAKKVHEASKIYENNVRETIGKFLSEGDISKLERSKINPSVLKAVEHLNKKTRILNIRSRVDPVTKQAHDEQAMTYSDMKSSPMYKDMHSDMFDPKDFDPIVKIYKDASGNDHVSMVDITRDPLLKRLKPGRTGTMSTHHSALEKFDEKISLLANNEGVRKMNMIMAAMAMKKANPKIIFDSLIISNISKNDGSHVSMFLPNYLAEMRSTYLKSGVKGNIGPKLKELFEDDALFDANNYSQDYLGSIIDSWQGLRDNVRDSMQDFNGGLGTDRQRALVNKMDPIIKKLNDFHDSNVVYNWEIVEIYKSRMNDLINEYAGDLKGQKNVNKKLIERLANNWEYNLLSRAIEEIQNKGTNINNRFVDMSFFDRKIKSNYGMTNPIVQWFVGLAKGRLDKIGTRFQAEIRDRLKGPLKLMKEASGIRVEGYLIDTGHKYYEPLFKTTKGYDKEGNSVDVNTNEIHFRKKDASGKYFYSEGAKSLMESGMVSPASLDLAGHIVEIVKDLFVELQMEKGKSKEDALEWYDHNWKDGMMPIIKKRASEKFWSKNFKEGISQWASSFTNSDETMEYLNNAKLEDQPHKVTSRFQYQTGDGKFGSKDRQELLGIEFNENGDIIVDKSKNEDFEKNLELMINYMGMNTITKVELQSIMPEYYASQVILHNYEKADGTNMEQTSQFLEDFVNFNLKGRRQGLSGKFTDEKVSSGSKTIPFGKNSFMNINVDNVIHSAGSVAAFGALAGNVFVDVTNLLTNVMGSMSFAVASQMANTGFFGMKEWSKAVSVYSKNPKLIMEIMDTYRVADMDLQDMINNTRFYETRNHFNSHHLYWLNFAGDYLTRGLAFTAQMIKEGTFDAHSLDSNGKLKYDQSLDGRKDQEGWHLIKEEIMNRQRQEGSLGKNGEMVRAYDSKQKNSIKTITDKFIMGGYDRESMRTIEMHILGKQFTMFKRYLYDKYENFMAEPGYIDSIGKYRIEKVKLRDGTEIDVAKWEGTQFEGTAHSIINLYRELMVTNGVFNFKGMKESWDSDAIRRMNIYKLGLDAVTVMMFFAVAGALFDDEDASEQQRRQWKNFSESRAFSALEYSFMDLISGQNPKEAGKALLNPFFAPRQAVLYAEFLGAAFSANTKKMATTGKRAFGFIRTPGEIYDTFNLNEKK